MENKTEQLQKNITFHGQMIRMSTEELISQIPVYFLYKIPQQPGSPSGMGSLGNGNH